MKTTTSKTASTPAKSTPPAPVEPESHELIIDGDLGFTDEEISSGGEISSEGYVAQYPYMVRTDGDEFVISSTSDQERQELHRAKTLTVVAFFGHSVYRLHRGHSEGLTTDMNGWSDEDREVVAQSYDSPFGRLHKSRGNFDAVALGHYLDDKELRKQVKKRLYLIVMIPGVLPKGALAICTFGGSALKPFQDYNTLVQRKNIPLAYIKTELSLFRKKNDVGQSYAQVVFKPAKNEDGTTCVVFKSADQFRAAALPILNDIKATHKLAVEMAESNVIPQAKRSYSEGDEKTYEANSSVITDESLTPESGFEDEEIPWL